MLYGPRGNGKTTLLFELLGWAREGGAQIRLRPANQLTGDPKDIAQSLYDDGVPQPEVTATAQANVGVAKGSITFKPPRHDSIESALVELATSRPTVLLIDEAHTLSPEMGVTILNAAQVCVGQRIPLLTVLSGTPGIRQSLRKMGASFWERCTKLKVGRLESDAEVREALSVPATQSGLPFEDSALDLLVSEAQRYPFFIQLLGDASWEVACERGHDRISLADAQEGVRAVNLHREELYGDRADEITDAGLYDEALAVSRAITDRVNPVLSGHELDEIMNAAVPAGRTAVLHARDGLVGLGLIWETSPGVWEPGIPSLCKFIVEQHREG